MSLATTVGAGTLLGGLLAVGVYSALAPSDTVAASTPAAPSFAPVPTPTITVDAEDCEGRYVLEDGICVLHVPGPTVTVAPPAQAVAPTRAATTRTGTSASQTSESYESEDSYEHEEEDGEHEDEGEYEHEHEDEDEDHEDGEHDR